MIITTMQHIGEERLALYAEHERLCKAPVNDRVANEKRQEVWRKLVKLPSVCDVKSNFITNEDGVITEQVIDITWRE